MKKYTALVLIMVLLSFSVMPAGAKMIPTHAADAMRMIDPYSIDSSEDYVIYYYSSSCSYSRDMMPVVEKYCDNMGVKVYSVDHEEYGTIGASKVINSAMLVFPIVIAYNSDTRDLTGINSARDEKKVKNYLNDALNAKNPEITIKIGEYKMYVNGEKVPLDVCAKAVNNRTLVPMRAIFEALGAEVTWYQNNQAVVATRGVNQINLYVGSKFISVNHNSISLDVEAVISSGRVMVPLRAVAEAFGCEVNWDRATNTVTIK